MDMTFLRAATALLVLALWPSDALAQGAGNTRIEHEVKLSVPAAELEAVRAHLAARYGAGPESLLPELGSDFSAQISDEFFVDRYFDTVDLDLIALESGVRRRQRWNLGDPTADRKHGRELLQLKLRRSDALQRTEVKFKVDPPKEVRDELDRHTVLGIVERKDRPKVIAALDAFGVEAEELRPTITLEQRRWRVYISRAGKAFATLTLDEVSSRWIAWKESFVELEIELNEVLYTEATPEDRTRMEAVSRRLRDDVLAAFPSIEQDQTPKYNKLYDAFEARIPGFATLVVLGDVVRLTLLLLGAGIALVVAIVYQRKRRRPRVTGSLAATLDVPVGPGA